MIIKLENNPLDRQIALLQEELQAFLFGRWGIDPEDPVASKEFIFYPRAFRNPAPAPEAGFIAEIWTGKKYQEVYFDKALKGLAFFGSGPKTSPKDDGEEIEIHLVAFADFKKIYNVDHRADYELRRDFQKVFEAPIHGFTWLSTETWLQNVLKEYPGSRRDNRLGAADMGTVHAFRLNLRLKYDPDAC